MSPPAAQSDASRLRVRKSPRLSTTLNVITDSVEVCWESFSVPSLHLQQLPTGPGLIMERLRELLKRQKLILDVIFLIPVFIYPLETRHTRGKQTQQVTTSITHLNLGSVHLCGVFEKVGS